MDQHTCLYLIYESIQESARQARLSSGRPSSQATLEEALQQVAMLEAAKAKLNYPIYGQRIGNISAVVV